MASAVRVTPSNAQYQQRLDQPWQQRALFYCDNIGELHYASNFYGRMLQRLRIFPAIRNDDDSLEPIESGAAVDLLNRIQDPGGGRTAILGMYGKLMFQTGEGYLFGHGLDTDEERWQFVWREELRFDDIGKVTHVAAPSLTGQTFSLTDAQEYKELDPDSAVAYRMWTPHPRFSRWADSPMRAVLDESEELLILSRSVHATATSRLVRSKLLAVPEEIAPAPPSTQGDEDPLNDPFLRQFTEHLERAIEEPGSASSLAPFVLYAGSEWIEKIRPIDLHDTESDYLERDLRTETVRRLARGLDLPPEVIEGMSDANHWAAWWISDDMWRSHGAPKAEQFCDDLSESYLRPALRELDDPDWKRTVVAYDASAVVVNPDRSKDADQAWDRGAIGYTAYRNAKNFTDDDAQTAEEHVEWLATRKVVVGPDGKVVPDSGNDVNPGDEPGTPDGEPGPVSEGTNLPASAARFIGAADLAVIRCRELAGSRLRSRRASCPDCLERVNGAPNALVAAALGHDGIRELGAPDALTLVAGGADSFRMLLSSWGYDEREAATVAEFIELHAARSLTQESPPPVPEALARR